ncbi:P-loop containing nucleoside triphosphate hydrolase protein [Russula earlei]|uniref:P-loop containing nucleoside triphosphate hydrolase protein n=1 Tax=Russula earlei TaxID=71964 RepID=A0ACC0TYC2_9AGAM|nr:P-loop containing nucleoside triphosphate hydrolase protein [Russula earlei]
MNELFPNASRGTFDFLPLLPPNCDCLPFLMQRHHFRPLSPRLERLVPRTHKKSLPNYSTSVFRREAPTWATKVGVRQRLLRFGIPQHELPGLLTTFAHDVQRGKTLRVGENTSAQLTRLSNDINSSSKRLAIDQVLTSFLYNWATDPRHKKTVHGVISNDTLDRMTRLRAAVDFTRIADGFPLARGMRRKVILHVGPTNSGKTHTALRTLASARVGAYGGPLRLLAHEIYERLNTGQIVPLGIETADNYEADETSNLDVQGPGTPRAVLKHGNALFARPCSLLTGDERRIIEGATLYSCTVEMLSLDKRYDVVVIDEIQMIADSQRGQAWTAAFLGTAADELHLCGEERAVPIVEALSEITGDELIINRYQRLSPLEVASRSLERDLTRIRRGDCVVTFSRSNIFNLKRDIEEKTGLRCAVVYGRLPPEIRAEQAALFNDPDSGFDVLIASDAIGMGLNLKIRRVVFETMSKWDGWMEVPLEVSQVKQIAGRAGRYGMGTEGGVVTTLEPSDLPLLKAAMDTKPESLRHARVGFISTTIMDIFEALPPGSTATTVRDALLFCSALPPSMAVMNPSTKEAEIVRYIDAFSQDLTFAERTLMLQCPFPSMDDQCKTIIGQVLNTYQNKLSVDLRKILLDSGLLATLEQVLASRQTKKILQNPRQDLASLETLHSVLTVYAWLSLRNSIAFYAYDLAVALKKATQDAMVYCLRSFSTQSFLWRSNRTLGLGTPLLYRQSTSRKMTKVRA